ncbi:MAG: 6,7-dimethyl-8-ribityllumazine synthase [Planctomycetes bacterium]|nr:6,7-dimethyl-8-ribityllumazine synthase [Planctomycetota bacterium]
MAEVIQGGVTAGVGWRFAVAVSRFHEEVTGRLLEGCLDALGRHGVDASLVRVAWVPGAFELPLVAKRLASTGLYRAVICLGAVIRGETGHYEMVASEAARGIGAAARETGVPCIFGVLTTETEEQALDRSGGPSGHKGADAAVTAIEMASLLQRIFEDRP